MATLKDLAHITGLSTSTISRVLNNDSGIKVAQETRKRIYDAVEETGYVSPRQRRGGAQIGIAMKVETPEQMEDVYYLQMKNAIEEYGFLCSMDTVPMFRSETGFKTNRGMPLDGILAIGRFTPEEIAGLRQYTPTLVFLDSILEGMEYTHVYSNAPFGIELSLRHLLAKGHKSIGFLGNVTMPSPLGGRIVDPRKQRFEDVLKKHGLFDERFVVACEMNSFSSYERMHAFLQGPVRPTAFVLASDTLALGVIKACMEGDVHIPADLSIVTMNNTYLSQSSPMPLTTVDVHVREIARMAVDCMADILAGNGVAKEIIVGCDLVERASVRDLNV